MSSAAYTYTPVGGQNDETRPASNLKAKRFKSATGWTPYSLSTMRLVGFIVLFSICLTSLILLQVFAQREHGFTLITKNHYTWVYGPTLVLVIITSLWNKVHYHCRALQPWAELYNGPASAHRTILLDHITPFQPLILYNAARQGHLAVAASMLGLFILRLVTLASTGLLVPGNIVVGPVTADLNYGLRMINGSAVDNFHYDESAYIAFAIMDRGYKLPNGTADNLIYETFEPSNRLPNLTYSATVQAFVPQVVCDPLSVINVTDIVVELNDPSSLWTCENELKLVYASSCDPKEYVCPPRVITPIEQNLYCNRSGDPDRNGGHTYLMAFIDVYYNQTFNGSESNYSVGDTVTPSSYDIEIRAAQAVLCQVSYSVRSVNVTYDPSHAAVSTNLLSPTDTVTQFSQYSNLNLTDSINNAGGNKIFSRTPRVALSDTDFVEQPPFTMFNLIAMHAGGDYQTLLDDQSKLTASTEYVMTQIAMQVGSHFLLQQDNSTLKGQQQYIEERLQIQPLSIYVMIAGFGLMALLTIAVIYTRPVGTTESNPELATNLANKYARSVELATMIERVGQHDEKEGTDYLNRKEFSTRLDPILKEQIIHTEISDIPPPPKGSSFKWWEPMALSTWFVVLSISLPIIIIVALEILQHLSDKNRGLASLAGKTSLGATFDTRFLPAMIMFIVASLFDSIEFNVLVLAPFNALKTKLRGTETFGVPLLSQLPPMALYQAFKQSYWTACLTMTAALVGSVLTIIVSGLYTVEQVGFPIPRDLYVTDKWNLSVSGTSITGIGTGAVVGLVESANLTDTPFTYEDIAFPALALTTHQFSSVDLNTTGSVSLQMPALRAELSCTDFTAEQWNWSISPYWTKYVSQDLVRINITLDLPNECHRGSPYGNESYIDLRPDGYAVLGNMTRTYFGQYLDVHVGPYDAKRGADLYEDHISQPDNPPGCPTSVLIYGYVQNNDTEQSSLTTSYCYNTLKTLNVNVTWDTPGLTVSTEYPPVVDESSAKLVNSGPNGETGFPWRLQSDLEGSFVMFDTNAYLYNRTSTNPYLAFNNSFTESEQFPAFSSFFQAVVGGRTPINVSALTDKSDPERAFNHIQQFYGRYMAQVLSASMRIPNNSSSQMTKRDDNIVENPSSLTGQFTPANGTPRLMQNRTPKIVLQIMLGVMAICGILAWIFGDFHQIVPWNPCTIAGTMVLFSGSKLCGPISKDVRAPKPTRETLDHHDSYDGYDASSTRKIHISRSRYSRGNRSGSDIELDSFQYDLPHDRAELDSMDQDPRTLYPTSQGNRSISDLGDPSHLHEDTDTDERHLLAPDHSSRRVSSINEADITSYHRNPSIAETDTDKESVLITGKDEPRFAFSIRSNVFDDVNVRLRLGWWKDGVFMGSRLPKASSGKDHSSNTIVLGSQTEGWEYRIDKFS